MQIKWITALPLLLALASCYPDKECSGELVFDDATALCYACPKGAKFKNETCECQEGYEYVGLRCVLMDGAMPPMPDAGADEDAGGDAAAYEGNGCQDYCSFTTTCLGGNALAPAVLPDVVMGLHADNAAQCESSCKSDLGSAEASDPALACIVAGKDQSMCTVADPAMGLMNTFGLIGECCMPNPSSTLCKSICAVLKANPLAGSMVPFCN